jgi:site-specific DNA-cytosine methylase
MRPLIFGSLFAGIGGFDLGYHQAGMRCAWQVEIDPAARSVLAHHWPDVPRPADVRDCGAHNLAPVDVICGGFPCQDLSVAGNRAGLAGKRSGLFYELVRVVNELQPKLLVWENVPGLLSGKYQSDEEYHSCVCGWISGWRGVHHDRGEQAVLNVGSSLYGNSPSAGGADAPAQSQGTDGVSHAVCPSCGRPLGTPATRHVQRTWMGDVLGALADIGYFGAWSVLDAQWFGVAQRRQRIFGVFARADIGAECCAEILSLATRMPGHTEKGRAARADVARGITASAGHHGRSSPRGDGSDNLIALRTAQTSSNGWGVDDSGTSYTLDNTGGGAVLARALTHHSGRYDGDTETFVAATLGASFGRNSGGNNGGFRTEPGEHLVLVPLLEIGKRTNGDGYRDGDGIGSAGDPMYTLQSGAQHGVGSAFGVRRLTPTECERLQGFPDGWTARGADGPQSDSVRYRQLGNAVCVRVSAWLGKQIVKFLVRPQELS